MADSEQHSVTIRAGEYVLGTLDVNERVSFDQECSESADAREELAYWEHRLGVLGLALTPVDAPAHVWTRIQQRLTPRLTATEASSRPTHRMRSSAAGNGWRSLAIAASVAALVMAGLLFTGSTSRSIDDAADPAYASMVYDAPTGTSWLVTAPEDTHAMSVTALSSYDVPDGKVLQAWLVPANGKPLLLGEWPHTQGRHRMPVSDTAARYMRKRASLMVSMEDAGAVVADGPSGPLMWKSPIARRTS